MLVADLFLFCYERDFLTFLFDDDQADIIEAFDSTSRYLEDLRTISKEWSNKFIHMCLVSRSCFITCLILCSKFVISCVL